MSRRLTTLGLGSTLALAACATIPALSRLFPEGVGASGTSVATTSSGSPVSRSTYVRPASAWMTTSRPVEGVRMR